MNGRATRRCCISFHLESSDEKQRRILTLIEELGEKKTSMDNTSRIQLAFVDQNFHNCSTCSGSVKLV